MSEGPSWNSPEYQELLPILYGFWSFQLMRSGVELGLFDALSQKPGQSRAQLAEAMKVSEPAARLLLLGCCSVGLLRKSGETYHNGRSAEALLVKGKPQSAIPFVQSAQALQYQGFFRLTEALREGTNAGIREYPGEGTTLYQRMNHNADLERALYDAMNAIWSLCEAGLDGIEELKAASKVLDVAGGVGRVAKALTDRYPQLKVTVFDRPSACEQARANAKEWGRTERILAVPGDLLVDPFPEGFDAINFAHCLEWLSQEQILAVMKKAHRALPSGGQAFCFQFAVDDAETGPLYSARLSMYFYAVETGAGMAYPARDLERLFASAGFVEVRARRALPFEHVFVSGRKP
jgi:ubiquinone/menaquinone biosynthesis C-methylase UbiE